MRRLSCLILTAILLCTLVTPALAATENEIMPLWDTINTVYACLTINETTGIATCTGTVSAKNNYSVEVDVALQILENGSWRTLKTWSASGTWDASCTKYYAVYRGYTYRVYVTGYVYNSSGAIIESGSAIHSVYF